MDGWMDVSFLTSDEIWNIWDERVGCERIDGSWREREGPIDVWYLLVGCVWLIGMDGYIRGLSGCCWYVMDVVCVYVCMYVYIYYNKKRKMEQLLLSLCISVYLYICISVDIWLWCGMRVKEGAFSMQVRLRVATDLSSNFISNISMYGIFPTLTSTSLQPHFTSLPSRVLRNVREGDGCDWLIDGCWWMVDGWWLMVCWWMVDTKGREGKGRERANKREIHIYVIPWAMSCNVHVCMCMYVYVCVYISYFLPFWVVPLSSQYISLSLSFSLSPLPHAIRVPSPEPDLLFATT